LAQKKEQKNGNDVAPHSNIKEKGHIRTVKKGTTTKPVTTERRKGSAEGMHRFRRQKGRRFARRQRRNNGRNKKASQKGTKAN